MSDLVTKWYLWWLRVVCRVPAERIHVCAYGAIHVNGSSWSQADPPTPGPRRRRMT